MHRIIQLMKLFFSNDALDLMSSTQPIEIKIYGDNQLVIQNIARQVAGIVESTEGTADVFNGIVIAGPSVSVSPDNLKLAQFGITPEDFQFQLQTQLEGNLIGSIYEKEQQTDIRMLYPNAAITSLDALRGSNLYLPNGKPVPLTRIANITVDAGVSQISRENLQSMIAVIARLDQRDLGSVMKDIQEKIGTQVNLPQGYHISYGGAYQEQQTSFGELLMILILAGVTCFYRHAFSFQRYYCSTADIIYLDSRDCRQPPGPLYHQYPSERWKLYRYDHDYRYYRGKCSFHFSAVCS